MVEPDLPSDVNTEDLADDGESAISLPPSDSSEDLHVAAAVQPKIYCSCKRCCHTKIDNNRVEEMRAASASLKEPDRSNQIFEKI